ncbi:MAG: adenosine deaminase [Elusimicrobia bacterium RIFCSPHIGHO2_02_FULL_57_9]|nr:MAG: adenosine deaminase [Elusimicrobia bacterium RIFCSPHIGHO2_02_FULL_57_9]
MSAEALDAFFRRLPKTDIHCHLDGSLRPATVLELARRYKVKMPADNLEDLTPHVQVAATCRSLKEFLDVFYLLYPLLRYAEAIERIAYELIEDCAAENIRHVEVRLAPELQATEKLSSDQVISAVLKGLKKGLEDFGTTSSVIICLFRAHGPKENRRAFSSLRKFFKADSILEEPAVVGLDLAGDEAKYPTIEFSSFYEEAKKLGLYTTCHAGETVGTANLTAALELSVMRIGHGIHLMEDPKLLAEVVRRRVPLEIGLTSNMRTKSIPESQTHPARAFHRAGVAITLNTDDRGILGIDLTHEYAFAHKLGFTADELAAISLGSVDHLFMPSAQRAKLRRRFEAEISDMSAKSPK